MPTRTRRAQAAFASKDSELSRAAHQSTELAEIASGKSDFLHGSPPSLSIGFIAMSASNLFLVGSLISTLVSIGLTGAAYCFPCNEGSLNQHRYVGISWFVGVIISNMLLFLASWIDDHFRTEFTEFEKLRERWEVDNYPEGEIQEMICIYNNYGITDKDAETVARILSKYKDFWVDHMLLHEIGILPRSAVKNHLEQPDDDEAFSVGRLAWKHTKPLLIYLGSYVPTSFFILRGESSSSISCLVPFIQLTLCMYSHQRTHQWMSLSSALYVVTTVAICAAVLLTFVQIVVNLAI